MKRLALWLAFAIIAFPIAFIGGTLLAQDAHQEEQAEACSMTEWDREHLSESEQTEYLREKGCEDAIGG
jgi:hypothetical protein